VAERDQGPFRCTEEGRTVRAMDTSRLAVDRSIELADGSAVELHQMHAADAARLLRFHHTLSPDTAYMRFFSVHPELSAGELHRFTHVDHGDREAIVATAASEIVAVARYDRLPQSDDAEVAFVVTDSWQGRGLGALLFDRLAERARQVGVRRFVADTLANNRRMLSLFHHAGLPVTSGIRDGVVHVAIELAEVTPA
jgi:GNAT superfamily N-acetyltransferase